MALLTIRQTELMMRVAGKASVTHSLDPNQQVEIIMDPVMVLPISQRNTKEPQGEFTKKHSSGWTVRGMVESDYYTWCNSFVATHPEWGFVNLDKNEIKATSRIGFEAFWYAHGKSFTVFDSGDI
jgi:hypothetical protein